jgi:hypothetical protein
VQFRRTVVLAPLLLLSACGRDKASRHAAAPASPVARDASAPDSLEIVRVEQFDGNLSISRIAKRGRVEEFRVRADSRLVYRDSTAYAMSLHTLGSWSEHRVAILEIVSGGTACPAMYRIVAFGSARTPRISSEFGDCSDIPVVMVDGRHFRVRFPGFYTNTVAREPGFRPPPPTTWEYLGDGRVRQLPAATSTR